jgi:YD repeat-containing protein
MKRFYFSLLLLIMLLSAVGFSQVDPSIEQGIHAFGTYDISKIDSVNVQNGGLAVNIPLFSYPQRGKFSASVGLLSSSKQWTVKVTCDQFSGSCNGVWQVIRTAASNVTIRYPNLMGIGATIDDGVPELGSELVLKQLENGKFINVSSYSAYTADGSAHPLFGDPGKYALYTADASGIVVPVNGNMTDRNGVSKSDAPIPVVEDPNGNLEQSTTGQDSMGRNGVYTAFSNAVTTTDATGCGGVLPIIDIKIVTFPGPNDDANGTSRQLKLCSVAMIGQTKFNALFNSPGNNQGTDIAEGEIGTNVLQSAVLYDGTSWSTSPAWTFEYNNNVTGHTATDNVENYIDLTKITFPTGGTITYQWATRDSVNICGYSSRSRWVFTRTVDAHDGSPPQISTYDGSGRVTDAQGNYVFHGFGSASGLGTCNTYEGHTEWHDLSSQSDHSDHLLKTVDTVYSAKFYPFDTESPANLDVNVLPSRITTTLPNNLASKVEKDYDSSLAITYWDPYYLFYFYSGGVAQYGADLVVGGLSRGLVTQMREYGFGSGTPGPLVRCTQYSYKALDSNSPYLTANILDLPEVVSVYSGACGTGTLVSQTTNVYDQPSVQISGLGSANQLNTSITRVRGNLTSVQRWLNTGGGVTSYTSYYDTGMPYQSTDANGNTTTYTYSPTYVGAYLTQTQMPMTGTIAHVVSGTYDFNTGLVTSVTDQNNHLTSYAYDTLARMKSATSPPTSTGQPVTTLSYPNLNTVTESVLQGKTATTTFDGLGRKSHFVLTDPGGNDTTDYTYDWMGRLASMSNPYRSTSDPTYGITSYTYDALNRMTKQTQPDVASTLTWAYTGNITDSYNETGRHWQRTADAFGNLTKVLEPNASNNPTIETDYQYDTLNDLTRVDQWGGPNGSTGDRVRTFTYDSLTRLHSATNAESGTTSYSYDNNGNTLSKTDARNITTSYTYDALNRMLTKTYSSNANGTPSSCFQFDSSSVTNGIGRLTNEWTQAGQCPASPPSSGFFTLRSVLSYDPMGRLTSEQQCTPTKCASQSGPQLSYGYDLAGDPSTLTNNANAGTAAPVTLTTCFDAAAHMNIVTGGSFTCGSTQPTFPATLYTLGNYGPVGPLNWNFGSNLSVVQNYTKRLQVQSITATGQVPQ